MLFLPSKKEGIHLGVVGLFPIELDKLVLATVKDPEEERSYFPDPVKGLAFPFSLVEE